MINNSRLLITNIFYLIGTTVLSIKGLNDINIEDYKCSIYINDVFYKDVIFISEIILNKKTENLDQRAFETRQDLSELKGIDLNLLHFLIKN